MSNLYVQFILSLSTNFRGRHMRKGPSLVLLLCRGRRAPLPPPGGPLQAARPVLVGAARVGVRDGRQQSLLLLLLLFVTIFVCCGVQKCLLFGLCPHPKAIFQSLEKEGNLLPRCCRKCSKLAPLSILNSPCLYPSHYLMQKILNSHCLYSLQYTFAENIIRLFVHPQ